VLGLCNLKERMKEQETQCGTRKWTRVLKCFTFSHMTFQRSTLSDHKVHILWGKYYSHETFQHQCISRLLRNIQFISNQSGTSRRVRVCSFPFLHRDLINRTSLTSSQDSSVVQRWVTGWMIGGSSSGRGWEFFSSPPRPDRLWDSPSLLSNGYQGLFPWG
jgi:hypothetical protein